MLSNRYMLHVYSMCHMCEVQQPNPVHIFSLTVRVEQTKYIQCIMVCLNSPNRVLIVTLLPQGLYASVALNLPSNAIVQSLNPLTHQFLYVFVHYC